MTNQTKYNIRDSLMTYSKEQVIGILKSAKDERTVDSYLIMDKGLLNHLTGVNEERMHTNMRIDEIIKHLP